MPADRSKQSESGSSAWLGLALAYAALLLYARVGHHLQQLPADLRDADDLLTRILAVLRI
ncbi:MAG: hypothetical protein ACYC5Y_09325 [Symbiobacteriia bacterium]